ncbi:c-type cytochrome [Ruegeria jejuensis]|uniref:c-type cytochrome n=1 Tax=Ruegeria jejuensis TaxID=3233338 RepID=UPI00355C7470
MIGTKHKALPKTLVILGLAGAVGFFALTSPWAWSAIRGLPEPPVDLEGADLENGRYMFVMSDCATCHMTQGQESDELLGGGRVLETPFGAFHMPNISPDSEHGIGNWTLTEFDRAVREGVGPSSVMPDGKNLYPAFPYTSYQRMKPEDVRDLYAYMMTLPASDNAVEDHELNFPFNIRRGIGVWRLAFQDGAPADAFGTPLADLPADVDRDLYKRGQYLVEGPAHCVECHSPRTLMGNIPAGMRYGGGVNPEGTGYFPNISPDETGIDFWSTASIANYLHDGKSPIGRTAGGDMAEVIKNTSQAEWTDLQAMAVYLKNVPPVDNRAPGVPEPNHTTQIVMLENIIERHAQLPVSDPGEIKLGDVVYVAGTKSAFLSADGMDGEPDGKLMGGSAAEVIAREADALKLKAWGWQLEEAPSVIYQEKGQRVLVAALGDGAIGATVRGEPEADEKTGQIWLPVNLEMWSDASNLHLDREVLWSFSEEAYQTSCSTCHTLPEKDHFKANQWIGTLKAMKRFTSFTDDEYRLILSHLQNHSHDLSTGNVVPQHVSESVPQ